MSMGRGEGRAGVTMFHTGRKEAIIYPNSGRMRYGRKERAVHGQHRKELQPERAIKKCLGIISASSAGTSVVTLKVSSTSEVRKIETPLIGGESKTMRGSTRG